MTYAKETAKLKNMAKPIVTNPAAKAQDYTGVTRTS
jgi:hypothetical protein